MTDRPDPFPRWLTAVSITMIGFGFGLLIGAAILVTVGIR